MYHFFFSLRRSDTRDTRKFARRSQHGRHSKNSQRCAHRFHSDNWSNDVDVSSAHRSGRPAGRLRANRLRQDGRTGEGEQKGPLSKSLRLSPLASSKAWASAIKRARSAPRTIRMGTRMAGDTFAASRSG